MIQAAAMHGTAMLTANPNVSPTGGTLPTSETQAAFASALIGSIPASGKDLLDAKSVKAGVSDAKSAQRTLASALTSAEGTTANVQAADVSAIAAPQSFSAGSLIKDTGKTAAPTVIADSTLEDASLLQSTSVIASQTASAASPVSSSTAKLGPVESALLSTGQTGSATQLGQTSSPVVVVGTPSNPAVVTPAVVAIASSAHATPVAQALSSGQSGEAQPAGVLNASSRTVLGGASTVTVKGTQSGVQGVAQVDGKPTLPASNSVSSAALQSANPSLNTGTQQVFAAPSPAAGVPLVPAGSTLAATPDITTPSGLAKSAHGSSTVKQRDSAASATSAQSAVASPTVTAVAPSTPLPGTAASAPPAPANTDPLISELSIPVLTSSSPGMLPITAAVSGTATLTTSRLSGAAISAGSTSAVSARQGTKKGAQTRPASTISNVAGQADSAGSAESARMAASASGVPSTPVMNAPLTTGGGAWAAPPASASATTVASMASSPRAGASSSPTVPTAFGAPSRISGTASPIISSVDESGASAAGANVTAPGAFAAATAQTGTAQNSAAANVVQPAIVAGQSAVKSVQLTTPVGAASANATAATRGTPVAVVGVSHSATVESSAATTVPQAVDVAAPVQHASAITAPVLATGNPAVHTVPLAVVPAAAPNAIATPSNAVPLPAASASPVTALASVSDHQTLVSTPNVLEVGVSSGTEGWLRIRAEMQPQTGEITASVVANSSTAVDSLHRQLPAMTAYLAGEQVNVSSVVIERSGTAGDPGSAGTSSFPGQSGQGNAAGQNEGGPSYGNDPNAVVTQDTWSSTAAVIDDVPAAAYAAGNGSWLNVRA